MVRKQIPIVTFYSYKGGTGRTTATANTAAALAVQGYRVCCLDMDLDGPGLAILFEDEAPEPHLQNYLLGSELSPTDLLIDKTSKLDLRDGKSFQLCYIPSGIDFRETLDLADGRRMVRDMERLFGLLTDEYTPDIILLDAPSGYGELSALSMYLSTCLVVLFRYSRQHVLGTVRVADFIKRFGLQHIPVPACVPPSDPDTVKPEYIDLLVDRLNLKPPLNEIRDSDELKWKERVLFFGKSVRADVMADYETLAGTIASKLL